jgi:hypothetical protein
MGTPIVWLVQCVVGACKAQFFSFCDGPLWLGHHIEFDQALDIPEINIM